MAYLEESWIVVQDVVDGQEHLPHGPVEQIGGMLQFGAEVIQILPCDDVPDGAEDVDVEHELDVGGLVDVVLVDDLDHLHGLALDRLLHGLLAESKVPEGGQGEPALFVPCATGAVQHAC